MMWRRRRIFAVGVAALLVATGCAGGSSALLRGSDITITADLESAAGMYEGNEVAILGMPVGQVQRIEPHGTGVTVTLTIPSTVKVPADVIVAAISPSVVTDRHIELTPAYSGDGPTLADGAHIPRSRTKTPVEIDEVISVIDQLSSALSGDDSGQGPVKDAMDVTANILDGNGEKMKSALGDLSRALSVGSDNSEAVTDLITNLSTLTQMVADNDSVVRAFGDNVNELTGTLAAGRSEITDIISQVNSTVENLNTLISENEDQFKNAFDDLKGTTSNMRQYSRELTEAIDLLPLTFQNIDKAVDPRSRALRVHILTDKTVLDNELLNQFCTRVQMKSQGCETGKLQDFGPDFGVTAMLLGLTE